MTTIDICFSKIYTYEGYRSISRSYAALFQQLRSQNHNKGVFQRFLAKKWPFFSFLIAIIAGRPHKVLKQCDEKVRTSTLPEKINLADFHQKLPSVSARNIGYKQIVRQEFGTLYFPLKQKYKRVRLGVLARVASSSLQKLSQLILYISKREIKMKCAA